MKGEWGKDHKKTNARNTQYAKEQRGRVSVHQSYGKKKYLWKNEIGRDTQYDMHGGKRNKKMEMEMESKFRL